MAVADCYGEIAAYFMGIRRRENRFARIRPARTRSWDATEKLEFRLRAAEKRGSARHIYIGPVGTRMAVLVVTGIGNKAAPRMEGHFVGRFTGREFGAMGRRRGTGRGLESLRIATSVSIED
jgi:hypothetical protein